MSLGLAQILQSTSSIAESLWSGMRFVMLTVCYLGAPHETSRDLTSEPVSNLPDSLEGAAAPQSRGLLPGRQRALAYAAPTPVPSPSLASTFLSLRLWL